MELPFDVVKAFAHYPLQILILILFRHKPLSFKSLFIQKKLFPFFVLQYLPFSFLFERRKFAKRQMQRKSLPTHLSRIIPRPKKREEKLHNHRTSSSPQTYPPSPYDFDVKCGLLSTQAQHFSVEVRRHDVDNRKKKLDLRLLLLKRNFTI